MWFGNCFDQGLAINVKLSQEETPGLRRSSGKVLTYLYIILFDDPAIAVVISMFFRD